MLEETTDDEVVYRVAENVTIYTNGGDVFFSGDIITAEDVGDLSAFRALVVAGKISASSPDTGTPPADDSKWNYTEIDDALSATSPNPVENRALYKEFAMVNKQLAALTEAMAEPIAQDDLRNMWTENQLGGD